METLLHPTTNHLTNATYDPILTSGDFNGNGIVDFQDILSVASRWFKPSGYHPLFDSNADKKITGKDVISTALNFGQKPSLIEQQIVEVFEASEQFYGDEGLETAISFGFKPFTPEFKGHGIHYYTPDRATTILEKGKDLDPSDFVGLNYSNEDDLLAVFYLALPENNASYYQTFLSDANDGDNKASFGEVEWGKPPDIFHDDPLVNYPDQEEWHRHKNMYFKGLGSLNPSDIIFEQDLSPEQLYARFSDAMTNDDIDLYIFEEPNLGKADAALIPGFWMMHLWLHELNPNGIFGATNPLVSPNAPDEHGGHGSHTVA